MQIQVNSAKKVAEDTRLVICLKDGQLLDNDEKALKIFNYLREERGFSGKYREIKAFDFAGQHFPEKYIFAGMGDINKADSETIRKLFGLVGQQALKLEAKNLCVSLQNINSQIDMHLFIVAMVEGLLLSTYHFDKYLTTKKPQIIQSLNIQVSGEHYPVVVAAIAEAQVLAEATCLARDLVNEPSNQQTPAQLAAEASKLAQELGMDCSIYDEKAMADLNLKAALAVGQGSPNPPRLIVLRYQGNPESKEIIGLVGKGITFDSGGLSLKNKARLPHMKHDMAGSAAVIGAMTAIAKRKLKINVTAVVAACENLLSGKGYKPGDIISSMAGKSILITSTDGEGRLTLADAITYAVQKEHASCIIDIATLTGGARAIFSGIINPVLSNNDELFAILQEASSLTGERVHRLPLMPEARALLETDIADIKNSSTFPNMRMQQGGMFVYEFVGNTPWVHIDISGAGLADFATEYTPAGGTGRGVRNLYHMARLIAKKQM